MEQIELYEKLKTVLDLLESDNLSLITKDILIDEDIIALFKHYKSKNIERLFKMEDININFFRLKLKCSGCNYILEFESTRQKIINYSKDMFLCENCKKEKEDEKQSKIKEQREEAELQSEITQKINTTKYIETYLNPLNSWNNGIKINQKLNNLKFYFLNQGEIIEYIKNMDYRNFLKTPYWKAISQKKLYDSKFRCQICNSKELLNVHHRTYDNHGDEIHNLNDLIVLCNNCHSTFHKEQNNGEK